MRADASSLGAALALAWLAACAPVPVADDTAPGPEPAFVDVEQAAAGPQDATAAEPAATSAHVAAAAADEAAGAAHEPAAEPAQAPSEASMANTPATTPGARGTRGSFSPRARGLLEQMEAALGPIEGISISGKPPPVGAGPQAPRLPDEETTASDPSSESRPAVATGHAPVRPVFSPAALVALDRMERSLAESRPISTVNAPRDEP